MKKVISSAVVALAALSPIAFSSSEDNALVSSVSSVSTVAVDNLAESSSIKGHVTPGTPVGVTLAASAATMVATHWLHGKVGFHDQPELGNPEGLDTQAFDY